MDKTIFAHRGASAIAPENTMAAFKKAVEAGATWIETDVDVLKDGTPILIHDSSLDRTTNRSGSYYDLTVSDLDDIDAGSWFSPEFAGERIPTLAQLVAFMNETGLNANIEIKSNEAGAQMSLQLVDAILKELEALDGPQVIISSFNHVLLKIFKDKAPQCSVGALFVAENLWDDWKSILELVGADYIHPDDSTLTRAQVQAFREVGYGVNVWTVNSPARANELFNWGVTGIFTDVAHQMLKK
ncbi:glycerophosphoryl diester phosphodiesterase [Actinomyces sp.]|uniref:glycerophosphoryl diester phosphodiesterase n=1 Tax=Actinomyces sp. TaxID=29317 RepID=UPI0029125B73|nr:glycerophosphoryl diester phosphodiesterase [Actinomyces sp.]MDU5232159.1 glycerophosphoryl diester phosphodiesterase [Actinomyces sp.]MDU6757240.1 glycerophosphoryl diester phosphodiesterase [Actinomyces sp.]MDU7239898.1 glycerophosphoryl diester phosphodiesterase [Actinomyces sp.]